MDLCSEGSRLFLPGCSTITPHSSLTASTIITPPNLEKSIGVVLTIFFPENFVFISTQQPLDDDRDYNSAITGGTAAPLYDWKRLKIGFIRCGPEL